MIDAREDKGAVRGLNIIEYVDVPQNNAKADLVIGYAFLDRVHSCHLPRSPYEHKLVKEEFS